MDLNIDDLLEKVGCHERRPYNSPFDESYVLPIAKGQQASS